MRVSLSENLDAERFDFSPFLILFVSDLDARPSKAVVAVPNGGTTMSLSLCATRYQGGALTALLAVPGLPSLVIEQAPAVGKGAASVDA